MRPYYYSIICKMCSVLIMVVSTTSLKIAVKCIIAVPSLKFFVPQSVTGECGSWTVHLLARESVSHVAPVEDTVLRLVVGLENMNVLFTVRNLKLSFIQVSYYFNRCWNHVNIRFHLPEFTKVALSLILVEPETSRQAFSYA